MSLHSFPLQQLSQATREPAKEILFGHFMTTLNDTFERELTQEVEGYESRSKSLSIPTPLIYHVSMSENLSFDPATPLPTAEQHPKHSPQRFISHNLYATIWCLPL